MSRVLPILFNTEMVRAILAGKKTVTRRVVRYKYSNTEITTKSDKYGSRLIEIQKDVKGETYGTNPDGSSWRKLRGYIEKEPPYKRGDILYVRETWAWEPCWDCGMDTEEYGCPYEYTRNYNQKKREYGCYCYKASMEDGEELSVDIWHPSIHMPKVAARIWLKVTNVKVEKLQDIDDDGVVAEGLQIGAPFDELWDKTIKKSDRDKYGWEANPWVWVIEFERCEKTLE